MKTVKFRHEQASAKLDVMDSSRKGVLKNVLSQTRGQGQAKMVLRKVVDYADQHQITVYLVIQRYGSGTRTLDEEQLQRFYEQFGFVRCSTRKPIKMFRQPSQ